MRFVVLFILASGAALAQHQDKGELCAEDVDCKGEQICVRQVCVMPPEPEKPAAAAAPATATLVSFTPTSLPRMEFSLAPELGLVSLAQNDRSNTNPYVGAIMTNAYSVAPALALVASVNLRYAHPSDGEVDRYLSIAGGFRLQTRSRAFAIDVLVGWSQLFAYQSVGGVARNGNNDGTFLGILAHYKVWGPIDIELKAAENLFAGFKSPEFGLGLGVRL
jgi:hypothetical protein